MWKNAQKEMYFYPIDNYGNVINVILSFFFNILKSMLITI